MPKTTRRWVLAGRPHGLPGRETFALETVPTPEAAAGQLLLKTLYISVDPYMRGRMADRRSYVAPFTLGEPLSGGIVAQVAKSRHPDFSEGDLVSGHGTWQEWQAAPASGFDKIDAGMGLAPWLGAFGMPGITAYFGVEICAPQPGQTMVVTAAAGAVGSVAGQIARLKGCRVVGVAGSDEKLRYLRGLGFDAAVSYRREDLAGALGEACPDGVDMLFENVGGRVTEAVLGRLNVGARIALCGLISTYNATGPVTGPNWGPLLSKRVTVKGFLVGDYRARRDEAVAQLLAWARAGKLAHRESVVEGFERVPDAFLGLFAGENIGKQVVRVADPKG